MDQLTSHRTPDGRGRRRGRGQEDGSHRGGGARDDDGGGGEQRTPPLPLRQPSLEGGLNTIRRGTGGHPLSGILTPPNSARGPSSSRRRRDIPWEIEPERGGMMRQDETQGCLVFVPAGKRGVFPSYPPFIEIRCRIQSSGGEDRSFTMRTPVHFVDEEAWGVSPTSPGSEGPFIRSLLGIIRSRADLGFWEDVELECRGASLLGSEGVAALTSNEVDARICWTPHASLSGLMAHLETVPGSKHAWLSNCRLVPPCEGQSARVTFDSVEVGCPIFARAVRSRRSGDATLVRECAWLWSDLHPHILPAVCTAGCGFVLYACDTHAVPAPEWLQQVSPEGDGSRKVYMTVMLHVALALEHMHRQGHVHLDVRPSNVMVRCLGGVLGVDLSERIRCELCDWGLSSVTAAKPFQVRRGTAAYWSPEQVVDLCPCGCERENGRPVDPYWRSSVFRNPPAPTSARITAASDSWGWATTLLGIMGQLQRMRIEGHAEFVGELGQGQELERVVKRCMTTVVRVVGSSVGSEEGREGDSCWTVDEARMAHGVDWGGNDVRGSPIWRARAAGVASKDSALVVSGASRYSRAAEEEAVTSAGRAILRNVVGHGGGEGSWPGEKRMIRALAARGLLERAEEACADALEGLVEGEAGLRTIGEAQLELGCVLVRLCKYEESLESLKRAMDLLAQHGGQALDRARALLNMGVALERLGQLDIALTRFEQGLQVRREALGGEHLLVAGALVSVAGSLQRLGRTRQALDRYLEAETVLISCLGPDELLVGEVKMSIGGMHADRNEHSLALGRYFDALALYWRAGAGPLSLAAQHRRIGEVYRRQGQLRKALAHFSGALDVRMRLLGVRYCGMCNMDVAGVHMQMGQLDLALVHYQRALECHSLAANNGTVNGEIVDVARALGSMALVYEKKRDWHRAWELCARALDRGRLRRGRREGAAAEGDKAIVELQARLLARKSIWSTMRAGSTDWSPLWVPDKEASQCKLCLAFFGLLLRRHHCRSCGHVVCDGCSGNRPRGKRVCDACYYNGGKSVLWGNPEDEEKGGEDEEHASAWVSGRDRGDIGGDLTGRGHGTSARFKVPDFTAENRGL